MLGPLCYTLLPTNQWVKSLDKDSTPVSTSTERKPLLSAQIFLGAPNVVDLKKGPGLSSRSPSNGCPFSPLFWLEDSVPLLKLTKLKKHRVPRMRFGPFKNNFASWTQRVQMLACFLDVPEAFFLPTRSLDISTEKHPGPLTCWCSAGNETCFLYGDLRVIILTFPIAAARLKVPKWLWVKIKQTVDCD